MSEAVFLSLLGVTGALAAALAWVVKKVFDFSERHVKVVEANTKSNNAVAEGIATMATQLNKHVIETAPALEAVTHTTELLNDIIKTQKEIIQLIKDIKNTK